MIQQTEAAREAIFEKAGIIRNSGRKYMALHGTYLSNSKAQKDKCQEVLLGQRNKHIQSRKGMVFKNYFQTTE